MNSEEDIVVPPFEEEIVGPHEELIEAVRQKAESLGIVSAYTRTIAELLVSAMDAENHANIDLPDDYLVAVREYNKACATLKACAETYKDEKKYETIFRGDASGIRPSKVLKRNLDGFGIPEKRQGNKDRNETAMIKGAARGWKGLFKKFPQGRDELPIFRALIDVVFKEWGENLSTDNVKSALYQLNKRERGKN